MKTFTRVGTALLSTTVLACTLAAVAPSAASAATGTPAPGGGGCFANSRNEIVAALNKSRALLAHSDLTVTEQYSDPSAKWTGTIDRETGLVSTTYQEGSSAPSLTVAVPVSGTKSRLFQRVGDGFDLRMGAYLPTPVPTATAQGALLRKVLASPQLSWLDEGLISESPQSPLVGFNKTVEESLPKPLSEFCAVKVSRPDGSVLYRGVGAPHTTRVNVLVSKDGTLGSIIKTDTGPDFGVTENFGYTPVASPGLDVAKSRVHTAVVDAALNQVLISDVGYTIAKTIANSSAAYARGRLSGTDVRTSASLLQQSSKGVYVLGWASPFDGENFALGWFSTNDSWTYPFAVSPVPNGVKITVVGGASRAVYTVTAINGNAKVTKVFSN